MEFRSIRVALSLLILLATMMVIFSCDSGPGVSRKQSDLDEAALDPFAKDDPCSGTDDGNRVAEIQRYLNTHSMRDEDLNDQRYDGHFRFEANSYNSNVANASNLKVVVHAYGRVIGHEGNNSNKPPRMAKLLRFLEQGMRRGCIDRVSFEPMPTGSPGAQSDGAGFEWQACPDPEVPCQPDGHCSTGGNCKRDNPDPDPKTSPSPSPSATP